MLDVGFDGEQEYRKILDILRMDVPDKTPRKTEKFNDASLPEVKQLLDESLLKPHASHNGSPTASWLVEFVEGLDVEDDYYNNWMFMGYVIPPRRSDSRVSLTGIQRYRPIPDDIRETFIRELSMDGVRSFEERRANNGAPVTEPDEFYHDESELRAWWD